MKRILTYKLFEEQETAELTKEQVEWLNQCTEGTWNLNPDTGLVDVIGSFDCSNQGLTDLKGIRFGNVSKDFCCWINNLTSLDGAPKEVGGIFYCSYNRLTSLVGAPEKVGNSFYCEGNQLSSLNGAPESVGEDFLCRNNRLTSLEGAPKEVGKHLLCDANQLSSLAGAPESVGGIFTCQGNPVSEKTLLGIYEIMKSGMSYQEALSEYWDQMPDEDKIPMYTDNPDLSDDEKRGYELRTKASSRIY